MIAGLVAPNASAAGGVTTVGAGFGTLQTNDGVTTCTNAPFVVNIVYAQGGAVLTTAADGCLGVIGFTHICCQIALDSTQNPILKVTFFCQGTEAAGLHCEGDANGTHVVADVGPNGGPGSSVPISVRGAYIFDGTFTAI
jgi:hypothetical protein